MREGETLKAYLDKYWGMFNEIGGDYDDVAISTFKPVASVQQLMNQIDKYRRVKEDQLQGKGKEKVIPQERRDFKLDWSHNNRPWKDFVGQPRSANTQAVNAVFREPVQQVLEKTKNESFFK